MRQWLHALARFACMVAMVAAAGGLLVSLTDLSLGGVGGAAALGGGSATIVDPANDAPLTTGGSSTEFRLRLPSGSACTGDSANDGYRIQSYLVPQSTSPSSLRFGSDGPVAAGSEFRAPLYDTTSTPYVNRLTAVANPRPGPGPIVQPIPSFSFAVYDSTNFPLPPGAYNLGIACTLGGPSSASQLDAVWNAQIQVVADPSDPGPAKIRFTTVSTSTTTPTTAGGSTTTVAGSTTTTASSSGGATTTTSGAAAGAGSTASSIAEAAAGATAGAAAAGNGLVATSAGNTATAGEIPRTGGSYLVPLAWAFLLLTAGRALVLIGRGPPKIVDVLA